MAWRQLSGYHFAGACASRLMCTRLFAWRQDQAGVQAQRLKPGTGSNCGVLVCKGANPYPRLDPGGNAGGKQLGSDRLGFRDAAESADV